MTKKELQDLMDAMSLEEKVNQLLQVSGSFYDKDTVLTGPMKEQGFTEENIGLAGSVIGAVGAEEIKRIQKEYMEKHPHHIPLLFMLDVINGFQTIFPIPLAQGASFEPELSFRLAKAAAKEAAVSGVHVTFAPMADLVRDARWGRVMESTGEDPYLNSLFAEAMVKGFQGENLKDAYHVAACVKHFAGYGAPTAGRDYNTVELSRHTLKEFYLPAYKAGIDAGAAMVMASFNTIEGVPATGNKQLLRNILREELGFGGVLISDWTAIEEMIYHGYCANRKEAALRALEAGIDIDMTTGIYSEHLCGIVREGKMPQSLIDEAVFRILELKNKLGLFEHPYKDANETKEKEYILCREHRELALEAAKKSFVLLKNEGILPLKREQKTAYIGPYVDNRNMLGAWSFLADVKEVKTLKEALLEKSGGTEEYFCQGCSMLDPDMELRGFADSVKENISAEVREQMMLDAVEMAKKADNVVLALGEHFLFSGEAASNAHIRIPKIQMELLDRICEVNDRVAVVLFSGRPLDIRAIAKKAGAVLAVWMPGTEGAAAISEVLFGEYNPCGRLPMCFPYSVGQVPVHYNEYSTGRPHAEGKDKDRFRSKYLDIPNQPLYPFGYGLSYTSFSISLPKIDKESMTREECAIVSVYVKNTGTMEGTETIQLYIHDVSGSVVRPVKELKDFRKVTLKPGDEKKICFTITDRKLQFLTEQDTWASEPGAFEIFVGPDSSTENKCKLTLIA